MVKIKSALLTEQKDVSALFVFAAGDSDEPSDVAMVRAGYSQLLCSTGGFFLTECA